MRSFPKPLIELTAALVATSIAFLGLVACSNATWGIIMSLYTSIIMGLGTLIPRHVVKANRSLLIAITQTLGNALLFLTAAVMSSYLFRNRAPADTITLTNLSLKQQYELVGLVLMIFSTFMFKWFDFMWTATKSESKTGYRPTPQKMPLSKRRTRK